MPLGVILTEGRVHELSATGFIPKDDELHLLLVTNRVDKPPNGDGGAIGGLGKVGNAGSAAHESRV